MKISTVITSVGVLTLFLLGVAMVKTNPSEAAYQQYAVGEMTGYLKSNVCKKTPTILEKIINVNCNKLLESANPEIRDIIAATTERHDFIIFSIYRTDLKINDWIPGYRFETVGAFDSFYTYSAEQK
jgi:Domain of unknown function (DUF4359)